MMAKLDDLVIGVSPLTGRIYAGYTSKSEPQRFTSKVDVTDQVRNAVVSHMQEQAKRDDKFGGYSWSYGELAWTTKET